MATAKPGPDIEDRPFQLLCYGRYRPPAQASLTDWQKIVLAKVRKVGVVEASTKLGITAPKVHTILASIRNKGWKV